MLHRIPFMDTQNKSKLEVDTAERSKVQGWLGHVGYPNTV
jgi:hypothetical protein